MSRNAMRSMEPNRIVMLELAGYVLGFVVGMAVAITLVVYAP